MNNRFRADLVFSMFLPSPYLFRVSRIIPISQSSYYIPTATVF